MRMMVDFIKYYMGYPRDAAIMALHMWRHNMMHAGNPRELFDKKRKISLGWLLHWGEEHMSRRDHFVLTGTNALKIDMTLFHLIEDLKIAQRKYFHELSSNPQLIRNLQKASKEINEADLRTP